MQTEVAKLGVRRERQREAVISSPSQPAALIRWGKRRALALNVAQILLNILVTVSAQENFYHLRVARKVRGLT